MACKCSPRARAVCGDLHCIRSFASHPRVQYWCTDKQYNACNPHEVLISTKDKCTFDCGHGHIFTLALNKVVQSRQWCWYCINKTEIKLIDWLKTKINIQEITIEDQVRFDWCRNPETGRHLPFDISIPSHRLIIEVDGRQHYLVKNGWPSPLPMQERDAYKMKLAISRGWTVIRVLQESIWWDCDDWEERLLPHLREHQKPRTVLLDSDIKCEFDGLRGILQTLNIPGTNS